MLCFHSGSMCGLLAFKRITVSDVVPVPSIGLGLEVALYLSRTVIIEFYHYKLKRMSRVLLMRHQKTDETSLLWTVTLNIDSKLFTTVWGIGAAQPM